MSDTLLSALFTICSALGIAKNDCTEWKILGTHQTDQSLWYTGIASQPDKDGLPDPANCRDPVPIGKYKIYDGSTGTSYACLAPLADDIITDEELSRIDQLAKRLNSISPKTLQDHEQALTIKNLVKFFFR